MGLDPHGFSWIGQPRRRVEDPRLLRGEGRFCDDFAAPGQATAVMLRSELAHARIRGIDAQRARAMPGVLAILDGRDCLADGLRPIPHDPLPSTRYDLRLTAPGGGEVFIGPHWPLPSDRVRHVGEAVAMVVAETPSQALDAAESVEVDLEPLPTVLDAEAAASGAPSVWDEVPDNVCVDTRFGDEERTAAAFSLAAHVARAALHVGRVTGVPLEPRAALGRFDLATGRYTLHAGSGGAVRHKQEIAAVLGVAPDRLRVICPDVGGNFGTRNRVYVEFALVLWAARRLGRPVKYTATRSESFLSDYQGRDLRTTVELALDAEGRFLALRADNLSNVGARAVSFSPLAKGAALVTGPYRIPAATVRARAAFTHTMPTQAYRSSGRPEVTFALERVIEAAAAELELDPIELRRRNLIGITEMPYCNPLGARYDSGEYEANMDAAMRLADWTGYAARAASATARGLCPGRGLANYVESSIGSPRERAELEVTPAGLEIVIGTQPSGQGHETSFAQVAADLLAVDPARITVRLGDTDVVSAGGGSHSGRSMRHAATVLGLAADDLVVAARGLAARCLEEPRGSVHYERGLFLVAGRNVTLDWYELAALARAHGERLHVTRDNEMHTPVYPNGCAVCEVEVDPETGAVRLTRYVAVDDAGRVVNPMIVHGQTHGAIAQGLGQALLERCVADEESAQFLTGSLMDYPLPRADDLPSFDTALNEVLSPTNPLGIKAGGEGGTTPALAAVVNAVVNALRHLGVREIEMPLTPHRVWRAIRDAREKPR